MSAQEQSTTGTKGKRPAQAAADGGLAPSRFTIRVKLLLFVGSLLALALGSMIVVVSVLFRTTIETQVQEYNLSLARLIGAKLDAQFHSMRLSLQPIVQSGALSAAQSTPLFAAYRNVLALQLITAGSTVTGQNPPSGKTAAVLSRALSTQVNERFLQENRLAADFFVRLNAHNSPGVPAGRGPSLTRVRVNAPLKLVRLQLPTHRIGVHLVVTFEASQLLESFQAASGNAFFELALIDRRGRAVISTTEGGRQVASERSADPIVRQMIAGQLNNGSRKYVFHGQEFLGSYKVLRFGGLGVVSRVPAERAFEAVFRLQRRNLLIMVMVLAAAFLFLYFFARGLGRPIRRLVAATQQVQAGHYDVRLEPASRDEIGILTHAFGEMAAGLKERERLRSEMAVARRIQTALLPERTEFGGHEVAAVMLPAEEVGGDYFDLLETRAGETWLAIGDVSGHGVESGLIQMMTQTSILSLIDSEAGQSPGAVLKKVNRVLRENIARLGVVRYITLTLMRLEQGELVFAGKHEDILIYRGKTGQVEVIETEGSWLGISESLGEFLVDRRVALQSGDTLLVYTDGLTEAVDADLQFFGEERLQQSLARHAALPLPQLRDTILAEVQAHHDRQRDDYTLLLLRLK